MTKKSICRPCRVLRWSVPRRCSTPAAHERRNRHFRDSPKGSPKRLFKKSSRAAHSVPSFVDFRGSEAPDERFLSELASCPAHDEQTGVSAGPDGHLPAGSPQNRAGFSVRDSPRGRPEFASGRGLHGDVRREGGPPVSSGKLVCHLR